MKLIRRIKVEPPGINIPAQIRLKGKWLEAAGFSPGDYVEVHIGTGQMLLQKVESPKSQSPPTQPPS